MFCYCFDLNTKQELESKGLKFLKTSAVGDKTMYMFSNPNNIMTFDKSKVVYTNQLMF